MAPKSCLNIFHPLQFCEPRAKCVELKSGFSARGNFRNNTDEYFENGRK